MFLIDKIIPFYFFISLFIGFFMVYIFTPPPKIIYKYPTPDNAHKLTFQDEVNNCYKYKTKKIACPLDKKKINTIPTQHFTFQEEK
jgi:hypothetical protein